MKVVVAIDSFKGSLTSLEAASCIKDNILAVDANAEVDICPIADGGEGTVDVLTPLFEGTYETMLVHGAYGNLKSSIYGLSKDKKVAIIEVAQVIGLADAPRKEPIYASTYGVGEIIDYCMSIGVRKFVIGLGGSCTNDGGLGMMQALGLTPKFTNNSFNILELESISDAFINETLKECEFIIASDVQNPLCHELGATNVFGRQKGLTEEQIEPVDQALDHYADLVYDMLGTDYRDVPGTGAAGGLGFAFLAFLNGQIKSGIDLIVQLSDLPQRIADADLVITGEGCIDEQSGMGKVPYGICKAASSSNTPVIGIGGSVKEEAEQMHELGLSAYFSIQTKPQTLEQAMETKETKRQLGFTTRQIVRFYKAINE